MKETMPPTEAPTVPEFEILALRKRIAESEEALALITKENSDLQAMLTEAVGDSSKSLSQLKEKEKACQELVEEIERCKRELALRDKARVHSSPVEDLYFELGRARDALSKMGHTLRDSILLSAVSLGVVDEADARIDFLQEVSTLLEDFDALLTVQSASAS